MSPLPPSAAERRIAEAAERHRAAREQRQDAADPPVKLLHRAWCLTRGCEWALPWSENGATIDREARRHTGELTGGPKPGHITVSEGRPRADVERRQAADDDGL